jgi:APA family basic amino acid/polyamine antiporter
LARDRDRLLRILGVGFGLAVTIGNTVGAGIFRAPGQVAEQLPDSRLYLAAWIVGGLYALLGALQIAELGTMIQRSGGQYVFARHALGDYAGFIVGWSDWISTCGTTAAVSILIGDFAGALVSALRDRTVPIAIVCTVVFAAIQWRGVRWGSATQNVTSMLKAVLFAALCAAAFALGGGASSPVEQDSSLASRAQGLALATAFLLALQSIIYTYDGWTGPVYFSEEMRDASHSVPRAVIGGVLAVIAIYLLVNVAFLYVLPVSRIAGNEFAAGAVAAALFGSGGERILLAVTVVSMLSALNAYHLMASRVLLAMSRDGLFSRRAQAINAGGTPTIALLLSAAVAVLFIVSARTFQAVITVLAFFFVANYTLSFTSVFVLRHREPDRERPYRAWGYPWTTGAALAGSVAFLVGAIAGDTQHSVYALLVLALSYPVFKLVKGNRLA